MSAGFHRQYRSGADPHEVGRGLTMVTDKLGRHNSIRFDLKSSSLGIPLYCLDGDAYCLGDSLERIALVT